MRTHATMTPTPTPTTATTTTITPATTKTPAITKQILVTKKLNGITDDMVDVLIKAIGVIVDRTVKNQHGKKIWQHNCIGKTSTRISLVKRSTKGRNNS